MKATTYQVRPKLDGRWVVFAAGTTAAVTTFAAKRDAVEHAFALAARGAASTVEILDHRSRREACGEFAMGTGVEEEEAQ